MAPPDPAAPAVQEPAPSPTRAEASTRAVPPRQSPSGFLVGGALVLLALALYLPYALKGGWYYDDWGLYENLKRVGGSWGVRFDACASGIPAGRKLACLYHVTEYQLFGSHRAAYHLAAIAFLAAMALLTYTILKRCRLPWQWAALTAALLIVFPSSDSTRLWPIGAIGQYVIVIELTGVLVSLKALENRRSPWRYALHAASAALFLFAMLTYEIAVPLVAVNGIVYWAACRNRRALWRGLFDLLLAMAFVFYRLALEPPDPNAGFTVERTLGGDVTRAENLLTAAWNAWHETFLPGRAGAVAVVAIIAIACLAALLDRQSRRRLLPWLGLLGGATVVAVAATLGFLTANDFYLPTVSSVFNRVTLPASIAYVAAFVALAGLSWELVRRFVPFRFAAPAAATILIAISAVHQLRMSDAHKGAWERSWAAQQEGLAGYRRAVRDLPDGSRLVGLGTPIWEEGFVPVFAASWDLVSALEYTTSLKPAAAQPLLPTMGCGRRGVSMEGALYLPYAAKGEPLYFIDSTHGAARRVRSQGQCRAAIERWGRPPFVDPAT